MGDDAEAWTQEQQQALQQALSNHPAPDAQDKQAVLRRWEAVAEAVPGKTRQQCVSRYKVSLAPCRVQPPDTHTPW